MRELKRFLCAIILMVFSTTLSNAETITLKWLNNDGNAVSSTTTCESGGDVILPATPTRYGYTFQGWKLKNYTPVEYLQSTGTQYIDTGYVPSLINTTMNITFSLTGTIGSSYVFLFGAGASRSSTRYWLIINSNMSLQIGYGSRYFDMDLSMLTNSVYEYSIKFLSSEVVFSLESLYDNSVNNISTSVETNGNSSTMLLFTTNKIQGDFPGFSGKIYSVQIYDNNVLVRDFIPVLDSMGIPCMYDKVSNQFFYNQGTGDFIAGPVISE